MTKNKDTSRSRFIVNCVEKILSSVDNGTQQSGQPQTTVDNTMDNGLSMQVDALRLELIQRDERMICKKYTIRPVFVLHRLQRHSAAPVSQ